VPTSDVVVGRIIDARVGVERVSVASISHCKIPILRGNGGEGVEHGYVGLDCDDANSAFSDTVCMLVSLRCTLESISKGRCDLKEGFRAVVALRIESDEAVDIVVLILPGRVEGKENRDFGDKFRSGSIFSIDRVDTPCGEICEQVTIYMVTV
jgi:hypothetical protein